MGATPEGKVKAQIKKILADNGAWFHMPVPSGYGAPTLDFHCSIRGRFFMIEAKAPGQKPTAMQQATIDKAIEHGIRVFVLDGDPGMMAVFKMWLIRQREATPIDAGVGA